MNEQASAWITAADGLPAVHERLLRVVVLCRPAIEVPAARDATCRTHGGILVVFTFLLNTPWGFPSRPQ